MAHARQELALGAHLGAAANGAGGEVEEHQAEHQHQQIQHQQAGRDQPAVAQALAAPLLHQHHRDAGDVLAEIAQALLAIAALGQRLLPGHGYPRRQQQRLPRPLQVAFQFRVGGPPLLTQPRLAGARGERLDLPLHLGNQLFQPGQGPLQLTQVHGAQVAAVEAGVDGDGANDAQVVAELAQPVQRQGQGFVGAGAGGHGDVAHVEHRRQRVVQPPVDLLHVIERAGHVPPGQPGGRTQLAPLPAQYHHLIQQAGDGAAGHRLHEVVQARLGVAPRPQKARFQVGHLQVHPGRGQVAGFFQGRGHRQADAENPHVVEHALVAFVKAHAVLQQQHRDHQERHGDQAH